MTLYREASEALREKSHSYNMRREAIAGGARLVRELFVGYAGVPASHISFLRNRTDDHNPELDPLKALHASANGEWFVLMRLNLTADQQDQSLHFFIFHLVFKLRGNSILARITDSNEWNDLDANSNEVNKHLINEVFAKIAQICKRDDLLFEKGETEHIL